MDVGIQVDHLRIHVTDPLPYHRNGNSLQQRVTDEGMTELVQLAFEREFSEAHLLGQHKSWVCRRLALLERLSGSVVEDLRLGLLGPALARQLVRLPAGNQEAVLALTRRESLTAQEVGGVIDLLQGASPEQSAFVLAKPREALRQVQGVPAALRDPRLSRAGNCANSGRRYGAASSRSGLTASLTGIRKNSRSPTSRKFAKRACILLSTSPQSLTSSS